MSTIFSPPRANTQWASYRPNTSSPLNAASSPPGLSTATPLSPISANRQQTAFAATQSSPIRGPPAKFQQPSKFASRPVKQTPLARSRQEAQDGRRKLFLQGARQRSEDKAWQRRDVESFSLRKAWLKETAEQQRRNDLAASGIITTDSDIEDAIAWTAGHGAPEWDDMMAEDTLRYEEMALDAMLADLQQDRQQQQPGYLMEEEEDFDQLLVGLVEGQSEHQSTSQAAMDVMMGD